MTVGGDSFSLPAVIFCLEGKNRHLFVACDMRGSPLRKDGQRNDDFGRNESR